MNIAAVRLESRVLSMPTDITVLLPEAENARQEKYKVIWLLHGAGQDQRSLLYRIDFEKLLREHPAVLVIPSALNSDFGNYEQFGTGYNFPAYFFDELMPFVYSTFFASPLPEHNFLAGISMGGFGTFSLGLQRPELFAALGVLGASLRESDYLKQYADMDSLSFRKMVLKNPKAFPTEYGDPGEGIKLKELNVITKYPTVQDFLDSPDCMWERFPEVVAHGTLPMIYVACGTKDLFYPGAIRLQELASGLGVDDRIHFEIAEGVGHEESFFDAEVGHFMDYYHV